VFGGASRRNEFDSHTAAEATLVDSQRILAVALGAMELARPAMGRRGRCGTPESAGQYRPKINHNGGDPMHEYDTAFKLTLQHVDETFRELLGTAITRWHNVELPDVRSGRVDLLGETETGQLIHIELQSSNDAKMAQRMLQYYVDVVRLLDRHPSQVVLYVGDAPAKMETTLRGPSLQYSYRLVDVRDLDGERLLKSPVVDDNIVGLLTKLTDVRGSVQQLLQRIAGLDAGEREEAFARLLILSELRNLGQLVEEEASKMPILNDIREHSVLGREYKKGELSVLRRQLEKRFGTVPAWAEERLSKLSPQELEDLSVGVLDAKSIDDLLK
jgi:hypothetical protein